MKKLFFPALLLGAIFTSCSDDEGLSYEIISDNVAEAANASNGFFLVNEDWFGHCDGSVNYFKKKGAEYDIKYNVYANANGGETLGTTTCHSAIWGDNIYFVSKQGNRLVVADAKTLKSKAVIQDLGDDGRAFQGVNEKKAYVGTGSGIVIFDLESNAVVGKVNGIDDEVGNIAYSNGKVFAITRNALFVINPETDKIIKQTEGQCSQLTMDRQGNIFVALSDKMLKVNSQTLATEDIAYSDNAKPADPWFAWNPGSMCYSTQTDHIYWTAKGKHIYKTDINTKTSTLIYTLGKSDKGTNLSFYGAGLRIDPLTDELIIICKHSGWGNNGKYNFIYKLNNEGKEIMHQAILDKNGEEYFWFPSLPVFEDANKPQILLNQVVLNDNMKSEIDLTEKIIDYDNVFPTMIVTAQSAIPTIAKVSVQGNMLVVEPGAEEGCTTATLSVLSNGVKVEKEIQIINEL